LDHDDEQIVTELKNGNVLAASWLNDKYFKILSKYLKSRNFYGLDLFMANSIINDTLLQAIDSIGSFENMRKNGLLSWLITIAERKAIDEKRKHDICSPPSNKFITYSELQIDSEEGFNELAEAGNIIAKYIYDEYSSSGIRKDERHSILTQAMICFTPEEQDLLRLHLIKVPNKEIAIQRKSNEEATKKYVNRLRHRFFKEIANIIGIDEKVINYGWKKLNSKSSTEFVDEGGAERT